MPGWEQSRAGIPGCTARLLSTFSPHSLLEQEAPSVTHYTVGQEQHLKCTSLNCSFIFLPVPLPEGPDHLEQMASLLSYQAHHQDPHHYSGGCWNVSHFFTVSEGAILDLSYSYLKKTIQVKSSRMHHSYHEEWEHHRNTRNVNSNTNDEKKITKKMFWQAVVTQQSCLHRSLLFCTNNKRTGTFLSLK